MEDEKLWLNDALNTLALDLLPKGLPIGSLKGTWVQVKYTDMGTETTIQQSETNWAIAMVSMPSRSQSWAS